MTKIKLGEKELNIKYAYEATVKSGIIKKFALFSQELEEDGGMFDRIEKIMELLPEMILVGAQKFHRDEFGYNYKTGEGKEEALSKIYSLVDDYFDTEDSDFNKILEDLQKEMLENGFLAKMFQKEMKKTGEEAAEEAKKNAALDKKAG